MVMVRDTESVKFLCSYGRGIKILPRSTDGKFRYVGGIKRILSVDRSISFAELMVKLKEFCGFSVTLRCHLPNGDLETLISIKSDAELADLLEEYDRANASLTSTSKMVRAILTPPASIKQANSSIISQPLISTPLLVLFRNHCLDTHKFPEKCATVQATCMEILGPRIVVLTGIAFRQKVPDFTALYTRTIDEQTTQVT